MIKIDNDLRSEIGRLENEISQLRCEIGRLTEENVRLNSSFNEMTRTDLLNTSCCWDSDVENFRYKLQKAFDTKVDKYELDCFRKKLNLQNYFNFYYLNNKEKYTHHFNSEDELNSFMNGEIKCILGDLLGGLSCTFHTYYLPEFSDTVFDIRVGNDNLHCSLMDVIDFFIQVPNLCNDECTYHLEPISMVSYIRKKYFDIKIAGKEGK